MMDAFLMKVKIEYLRARSKHTPLLSCHEGLAVIWEEFEEVKEEVFKKHPDHLKLRVELVQVAAMCLAFHDELLEG